MQISVSLAKVKARRLWAGCANDFLSILRYAVCNVPRYHTRISFRYHHVLLSLSYLNSFRLDHHGHGYFPLVEYREA